MTKLKSAEKENKENKGKVSATSKVSAEEKEKAAQELRQAAQETSKPEVDAPTPEKGKKRIGRPPGSRKKQQVEDIVSPDFLVMLHKNIFENVAQRVGAYEWKPSSTQLQTCSMSCMALLEKRLPDYLSKYGAELAYGGAVLLVAIDMMAHRTPIPSKKTEKEKTADDFGGMKTEGE